MADCPEEVYIRGEKFVCDRIHRTVVPPHVTVKHSVEVLGTTFSNSSTTLMQVELTWKTGGTRGT